MFTLTEEQRKQLLQYLGRRHYVETAVLIQMLASLTPPKKKEENKANNTNKSRN